MKTTFHRLWESSQGRDFWTGGSKKPAPELDHASREMVQRGLEVRPDREDGKTFWDDFIDVMSQNSDAASRLLGVPVESVAKWPQTIRKLLSAIRQDNDSDEPKKRDRSEMIQTGDR